MIQSVEWIRKEDRLEEELEFMNAAIRLIGRKDGSMECDWEHYERGEKAVS